MGLLAGAAYMGSPGGLRAVNAGTPARLQELTGTTCIPSCSNKNQCQSYNLCAGGNGPQKCNTCKKTECKAASKAPQANQQSWCSGDEDGSRTFCSCNKD